MLKWNEEAFLCMYPMHLELQFYWEWKVSIILYLSWKTAMLWYKFIILWSYWYLDALNSSRIKKNIADLHRLMRRSYSITLNTELWLYLDCYIYGCQLDSIFFTRENELLMNKNLEFYEKILSATIFLIFLITWWSVPLRDRHPILRPWRRQNYWAI